MDFKEVYQSNHFKIIEVTLKFGETMPLHQATSNAYVICREGKAKLIFSDRAIIFEQGHSVFIPAKDPHKLEVLENFKASIVMEPEAKIDFL